VSVSQSNRGPRSILRLGYGQDDHGSISDLGRDFVFFATASRPTLGFKWVQGAHSRVGGKAAGAWNWPHSSI